MVLPALISLKCDSISQICNYSSDTQKIVGESLFGFEYQKMYAENKDKKLKSSTLFPTLQLLSNF